mmetsp:Transcript_22989/g.72078  ORF Transcript_22989/g.72078 Transcript_22989/m.72078 type:complete len:94 (-) Transcript_22989:476-757(-)
MVIRKTALPRLVRSDRHRAFGGAVTGVILEKMQCQELQSKRLAMNKYSSHEPQRSAIRAASFVGRTYFIETRLNTGSPLASRTFPSLAANSVA